MRLRPPFSPPKRPSSLISSCEVRPENACEDGGIDEEEISPDADAIEALPTIRRTKKTHFVSLVDEDIGSFVAQDLDVSGLECIYGSLWMAGRPLIARSLQRLRMIGHDIIPTDQADLHLLKFSKRILVKPLPKYMLDYGFWNRYLCSSEELHESARGFLLSYIWLIRAPFDLDYAKELNLVPKNIEWAWWKSFVKDVMGFVDVNSLDGINKRYHYGELRLGRINSIYRIRFMFTHFVRGYLYEYNRYMVYFERNFGWLLSVFVYFSIILSSMEVGSSTPQLSESHAFQRASYGFVTFSIVGVVSSLVFVAVVFTWIFFYNMVKAIEHARTAKLEREKCSRKRDDRTQD